MAAIALTCAAAEASGVAQVGEELAAAHVIKQHVEKRLVVVRPNPVRFLPITKQNKNKQKKPTPNPPSVNSSPMSRFFFFIGLPRAIFRTPDHFPEETFSRKKRGFFFGFLLWLFFYGHVMRQ